MKWVFDLEVNRTVSRYGYSIVTQAIQCCKHGCGRVAVVLLSRSTRIWCQ